MKTINDIEIKIRKLKKRKIIYVIIACFLILLNLLTDLLSFIEGKFSSDDIGYNIGYMIGSHFFFIFGLFLFYRVFKINRRINELKQHAMNTVVDSIGSDVINE
jgi:hypothetical protein